MNKKYFYINFSIETLERYSFLIKIFNKLKVEKEIYWDSETVPNIDIIEWKQFLDDKTYNHYKNLNASSNKEQDEVYYKLWDLTSPEIRINHPMFNRTNDWDFESVIHTIIEGEYELIDLSVKGNKGTLYFDPFSLPFGGTESLVSLIESFGNKVFFDSWHNGEHKRQKIGWDFELAKKLVSQNTGLT
jgi:hypothetical protein